MPRYKNAEWGDSGYDAVDHLIDNDPIELGELFRCLYRAIANEEYETARSIVDQFAEDSRVTEVADDF